MTIHRSTWTTLACAGFFAISSLSAQDKPAASSIDLKDPVAVVDGEKISKSELEEAIKSIIESSGMKVEDLTKQQLLEGYRQVLDEMVITKLLEKASAGITVSQAEIDAELAKFKSQFPSEEEFNEQLKAVGETPASLTETIQKALKQQKWMESKIGKEGEVSEDDIKKFYEENKERLAQPEMVKASHILFMVPEGAGDDVVKEKQEAAKKAAARAKKGENFNELAKELSEEPIAKMSGGDLGFFSKDRMVPEFSEAAFAQKVDDISDPVRTQFGWHVIKVEEKKEAGTPKYEEIKEDITQFLKGSKQQESIEATIKKLRDDSKVEVNLPPVEAESTN